MFFPGVMHFISHHLPVPLHFMFLEGETVPEARLAQGMLFLFLFPTTSRAAEERWS